MTAAVILVRGDVDRMEWLRVRQIHALYSGLGLLVDLVMVGADQSAGLLGPADRRFRRFASLRHSAWDSGGRGLAEFLDVLNSRERYLIAHFQGLSTPEGRVPADFVVAEPAVLDRSLNADLYIAEVEEKRTALAARSVVALRMPFDPGADRSAVQGQAIGWIGDWPELRVDQVQETLVRLSRHGVYLSTGIVLMGPGADCVSVPDNLQQWTTVDQRQGHFSVLGLAIAPGPLATREYRIIAQLIASNRPVLLSRDGAEWFEDRWSLPIVNTADDLLKSVETWIGRRDAFSAALRKTRMSYFRDLMDMTRYVSREIKSGLKAAKVV